MIIILLSIITGLFFSLFGIGIEYFTTINNIEMHSAYWSLFGFYYGFI